MNFAMKQILSGGSGLGRIKLGFVLLTALFIYFPSTKTITFLACSTSYFIYVYL